MEQKSKYIAREALQNNISKSLREWPITVLLGARQVGKTTLALSLIDKPSEFHHFDLEKAASRAALSTP